MTFENEGPLALNLKPTGQHIVISMYQGLTVLLHAQLHISGDPSTHFCHAADDARAMDFTNNSLNAMDPDTTDHEATDPDATDAEILEYLSSLVASSPEQG